LAVAALGFLVLYKATGVINFAHGDLITLGAYVALWAIASLGLPTIPGYLLALVLMFGVGVVIERLAYAPLRRRQPLAVVIATLAAAIALRGLVGIWQGSTPKSLPSPVGNRTVHILGAPVAQQRLLIVVIAAAAIIAVLAAFQRTAFGRQLRALAADPDTARLQGVRTRMVAIVAFGLSATLAALAGILVAPLSAVDLTFGFDLMISAFAAAVLGGFGSLGGVVAGSLVIGLVQQLLGGYVFTQYASTLPFILMLVVIAFRPEGLIVMKRSRL
ncbi:MAG TPA: branched-chain amino acid ABC transporter permease, partial [Acidimicrobiales bacterium]